MDEEKDCILHKVIENGDLSDIKLLLKPNIDVNAVDEHHRSALHIAVMKNKIEIAQYFVDNGADMNIKEKRSGMTPLHLAIKQRNVEMSKLLIASGANVNEITRHNSTALHIAIEVGNEELVKFILNNFANIEAKKFGKNPLHLATECGNVRFVKLLLDKGSNINDTSIGGQTALHVAVENKDQEMVKFLLDHGARIYKNEFGICPLYQAVESGLIEIVKLLLSSESCADNIYGNKCMSLGLAFKKKNEIMVNLLLEYGVDPDSKIFDKTPLYLAIECEWEGTVKLLLSKGAKVSAASHGNISALNIVLEKKNNNIAKLLIENGADVKVQQRVNGLTPLHIAVKNQSLEIVQLLLSRGACPSITSNLNVTPLHTAFDLMHKEMVETLIANNADTNIPKSGKSQIELSIKYKWLDIMCVLLEKGANDDDISREKNNMLIMVIKQKYLEALKLLLDFGADPNYINQKSMSPLQSAVSLQFKEAMELLIERGADVNYRMQDGSTALNIALNVRNEYCVKYLLENGASIHVKKGNMSPLHIAAECKWLDIAKILLDRGANVNEHNIFFDTPLIYAVEKRDKDMICLLLQYKANIHCKSHDYMGSYSSPLYVAAKNKYLEIVELLLDNGANINELIKKNFESVCALHMALRNGDEEMVKVLIKRGADITIKDQKTERTPLHLAAQFGCIEAAKIFLKNKAEVDKLDKSGATPLQLAVKGGYQQIAELLIEHGADVNYTEPKKHYSILHYAIIYENYDMTEFLLDNGARIHLSKSDMITPLQLTVKKKDQQLVELLLLYDFDENETISFDYPEVFIKMISDVKADISILSTLLQHLARKRIYDKTLKKHNVYKDIKRVRNDIHKELNSMRNDNFYGSYTMYKILTTKTSQLSVLTKNKDLLQAFEDTLKKNSDEYSYYHDILSKIMERAKETKLLRDRCEASLSKLFKIELPHMINQQILSYLPNVSLRFLDKIFQENSEEDQEKQIMEVKDD